MLCQLDSATRSPQHPNFTADVLGPLAQRQVTGEADGGLSMELYDIVHPWAVSFAAGDARRRRMTVAVAVKVAEYGGFVVETAAQWPTHALRGQNGDSRWR